jgi:hypothetical protein
MKYSSIFNESLFQAVEYYGNIDRRLALRFFEAVDRAKREIGRFPKIGKPMGKFRGLHLKEFPYRFCYQENLDGELVALVLYHTKQKQPRII